VRSSARVHFEESDRRLLEFGLRPGEQKSLPHQVCLPVMIRDEADAKLPGRVMVLKETLEFVGRSSRFQKELRGFDRVQAPRKTFDIRYSAELSAAWANSVITLSASTPLLLRLRNISLVSLGSDSEEKKRTLKLRFCLKQPSTSDGRGSSNLTNRIRTSKGLEPLRKSGRLSWDSAAFQLTHEGRRYLLSEAIELDVRRLQRMSHFLFSAELSLRPGMENAVPAYEQIPLTMELWLGTPGDPLHSERLTQIEYCPIQFAESFSKSPSSDFLFVVTGRTPRQVVEFWKSLAESFGESAQIHNVSVEGSFPLHDEEMAAYLEGKVLVISNDVFRDDATNEEAHPTDYFKPYDIFEAAMYHKISTYVIGAAPSFRFRDAILPITPSADSNGDMDAASRPDTEFSSATDFSSNFESIDARSQRKHFAIRKTKKKFLGSPGRKYLDRKAMKIQRKLAKQSPLTSWALIPRHSQRPLSCLSYSHEVGTIEVREALEVHRALIGFRTRRSVNEAADTFAVCKLLPFEKKLLHFVKTQTEALRDHLAKALLSDVVDEIDIIRSRRKHVSFGLLETGSPLTRERFEGLTPNLDALANFPFENFVATHRRSSSEAAEGEKDFKPALVQLLLSMEKVVNTSGDLFSFWPGRISGILKKKACAVSQSILGRVTSDWTLEDYNQVRSEVNRACGEANARSSAELVSFFRDPLRCRTVVELEMSNWTLADTEFQAGMAERTLTASQHASTLGERRVLPAPTAPAFLGNSELHEKFCVFRAPDINYTASRRAEVRGTDFVDTECVKHLTGTTVPLAEAAELQ